MQMKSSKVKNFLYILGIFSIWDFNTSWAWEEEENVFDSLFEKEVQESDSCASEECFEEENLFFEHRNEEETLKELNNSQETSLSGREEKSVTEFNSIRTLFSEVSEEKRIEWSQYLLKIGTGLWAFQWIWFLGMKTTGQVDGLSKFQKIIYGIALVSKYICWGTAKGLEGKKAFHTLKGWDRLGLAFISDLVFTLSTQKLRKIVLTEEGAENTLNCIEAEKNSEEEEDTTSVLKKEGLISLKESLLRIGQFPSVDSSSFFEKISDSFISPSLESLEKMKNSLFPKASYEHVTPSTQSHDSHDEKQGWGGAGWGAYINMMVSSASYSYPDEEEDQEEDGEEEPLWG
jgi:hypothetical protein